MGFNMLLLYYLGLILIDFIFGLINIFYIASFIRYLEKEYPSVNKWLSCSNYFGFKWSSLQKLLISDNKKVLIQLSSIKEASIFVEDKRFKKVSFLLKTFYISVIVIYLLIPIAILVIGTILD